MNTPTPRNPDGSPLKIPPDRPLTNDSWFRLGRSSERFEKGRSDTGNRVWPTVAGFEIFAELGHGETGVVFKARQIAFERIVALKLILESTLQQPESLARFQDEVRAIAAMQHPNIVPIYEVGQQNGRPFVILEYMDGGPLARWLRRAPPSPLQAAALLEPLARAIQFAHDRGFIHGDLNPSNILLGMDRAAKDSGGDPAGQNLASTPTILIPKIANFRLAKESPSADVQTRGGSTPQYMSPEQSFGDPGKVGPATDIYSLGSILYEMLTGRAPFEGASTPETLLLLRTVEPVSPRRLRPRTPKDLETICLKCLEKSPARRYAQAGDLADDLRRFLKVERIRVRPAGPMRQALRWGRRHPRPAALAAVLSLLVIFAMVVGISSSAWFSASAHHARQDAERLTKAMQAAELERHESLCRESDVCADAGMLAGEGREPAQALLWFARAVRLAHAAGDVERERANRIRFRNWERRAYLSAHTSAPFPANGSAFCRWAVLSNDVVVRFWATPRPFVDVHRIALPTASPVLAVVRADGKFVIASGLASAEDGLTVTRVFDVSSGRPGGPPLNAHGNILHAALSPCEPLAALAVITTGSAAERFRTMFDPAPGTATVQFWNWVTGDPAAEPLQMPSEPRAVVFSPDGNRVAVACAGGQIILIDVRSRAIERNWKYPFPIRRMPDSAQPSGSIAFSPDGTTVLVWGLDDTLRAWDVASGTPRFHSHQSEGSFTGIVFSPDRRQLATAHELGPVAVWDWNRGIPAADIKPVAETERAVSVRFSADGRLLLAALRDGSARVWDWRSGWLNCPALFHRLELVAAEFLNDPRWIATATADGSVRVWDRRDGRAVSPEMTSPRCHSAISTLDGKILVTGCSHGTIELYQLDDFVVPNVLMTSSDGETDQLGRFAQVLSGCDLRNGTNLIRLSSSEWLELAKRCRNERLASAGR